MSLNKIKFKKTKDTFDGIYRGIVVDNNDPQKYGRVKVKIYPMFLNLETENIPWAIPAFPILEGAGVDKGYFAIPDVDTHVWCFFEEGDMYQPVYFAEAPDAVKGLPTERETNYPNRKVLKFSSGIVLYIDDTSKNIKLNHPGGATILIDESGNITIQGTTVNINPV